MRTSLCAVAALLIALGGLGVAGPAGANPNNLSAPWKINVEGATLDADVRQAPDGTIGGGIYADQLAGYFAPIERVAVWLRFAGGRPIQAFVGQVSADGQSIGNGGAYALNTSGAGASVARNAFGFAAQRGASYPQPGAAPYWARGPQSVAGTHALTANGIAGALQLTQAADGMLGGTIYGERIEGHYAHFSGTLAFVRFSGSTAVQLFVGRATPQGMQGEMYALVPGAGASAQRMKYTWSAQTSAPAAAPAAAPPPAAAPAAPAPQRTAGSSGYEIVTGETAVDNVPIKQLRVACPSGKRAAGAGWAVLDPTGAILSGAVSYFQMGYDGSDWIANAENRSAFAPRWKLQLRVVCVTP